MEKSQEFSVFTRKHPVDTMDFTSLHCLFKFAGYIYNDKSLSGNIFGLIFKNKMITTGVFRLSTRSIVGPLEQRVL